MIMSPIIALCDRLPDRRQGVCPIGNKAMAINTLVEALQYIGK